MGCGSAGKLAGFHPEFEVIGVDFGPNIADCRATYSFGRWIEADFENGTALDFPQEVLMEVLIICSDVIGHLVNLLPLLKGILSMLDTCRLALISTPECSLKNGWFDNGPPSNPHHVREWTLGGLRGLMDRLGASCAYAGLTTTQSLSNARNTILLACGGVVSPGCQRQFCRPESAAGATLAAWRGRHLGFCAREDELEFPSIAASLTR